MLIESRHHGWRWVRLYLIEQGRVQNTVEIGLNVREALLAPLRFCERNKVRCKA